MTSDISREALPVGAARTRGTSWTVVEHDPSRFVMTSDDVLVIEYDSGRREPARWMGPLKPESCSTAEALVVAALRVAANGRPLRHWLQGGSDLYAEAHGWGALGLPDGWNTRVVPIASAEPPDDLSLARSSRGVIDLDRHPTLSLAPGDWLVHGEIRGTVVAIDRRAGTLKLDAGRGAPISIPIETLVPDSEAERGR